jgi:hypothetical protein
VPPGWIVQRKLQLPPLPVGGRFEGTCRAAVVTAGMDPLITER